MGHPSDGETWKVLDGFDVDFTSDARNVCFGLATLCMKFEFIFLCLIVPGLKAPSPRINVILKLLIVELK
jgi:hypothetical protein